MASDKIYTKTINRYFLVSTRNEQKRQKFKKTLLFLKKRSKFELIRNITHQFKSLRESFIPQQRAPEAFHYPAFVIRLQKER